jgi:hypothetical protein
MRDGKTEHSARIQIIVVGIVIFFISLLVSSSYRGIANDEGLGKFLEGATRIIHHQPIFDPENKIGESKSPARLLYMVFIAWGYKLCGINLLATHLFPYLLQILNPCLFLVVIYRYNNRIGWSLIGALFFIFHPFNLIFLNQQYSSPIFMFLLLLLVFVFESAIRSPRLLVICGVCSSLLMLTRFEEGMMFVAILYGVYFVSRWTSGIPVKWFLLSLGALLLTYLFFAWMFDFPLLFPLYYLPSLLQRQATYGARAHLSFYEMTKRAVQVFMSWYFCGKIIAPVLILFGLIGAYDQVKKRVWYPLAVFLPHFLFLLLVYNGRTDIMMSGSPYSVPGFILLLVSGMQVASRFCEGFLSRLKQPLLYPSIRVLLVVVLLGFFVKSAYALTLVAEDVLPASTMWRIVKYNPPLPGNPAYQESFVPLNRADRFPVRMREEIFKAVRGNYRSWYFNLIGEYAFEHGFPEKARIQADFAYVDDYHTKDRWEKDRYRVEGDSPLWNDRYAGRIGAFPCGKGGTFMYKFDFPKPIDYVILSDIHTQWGIGDVTRLWTSPDGAHWTLRYDSWNVHYKKDRYYQFFEDEFDGYTSLYIKYYFYAGDKTRSGNDNRGASLEEFSLAVKYQE